MFRSCYGGALKDNFAVAFVTTTVDAGGYQDNSFPKASEKWKFTNCNLHMFISPNKISNKFVRSSKTM